MTGTLNLHAYLDLITEDLEWLEKQPDTMERRHIEAILLAEYVKRSSTRSRGCKPFEREGRYTVLKISDVGEALSADECTELIELEEKVAVWREMNRKQPLTCVVVESDWPEYEPTWDAIQKRVETE